MAASNPILQFCLARGLPLPVPEYRGIPGRRFRFDWCWPDYKICLEVEGGVYSAGRHVRSQGYANDCEKYTLASAAGWTVLRYTTQQVERGDFMGALEQLLEKPRS